ncbi:MAG: pyrimidine 5'-nucleotidase [Chloroflexi bacterium]|nr:pyrimidine 5'-nucleotidase [Chloroflexota bacterium]
MSVAYVLFDLDDTLYPAGAGLMQAISARITRYVASYFGISLQNADTLRRVYHRRFGSAVHRLVTHHRIDREELLTFAHDVDVESYLHPDAELDCLLGCIQSRKAIFTNAPRVYVQRVLRALGIASHFAHVFDYEFGDFLGKPDPAVYRMVQGALKAPRGSLVMVDDAARNLAPAHALGWKTIWVTQSQNDAEAQKDYVVHDLSQIAEVFQQLGVMDATHRGMAEHRLAGCAWARKTEKVS